MSRQVLWEGFSQEVDDFLDVPFKVARQARREVVHLVIQRLELARLYVRATGNSVDTPKSIEIVSNKALELVRFDKSMLHIETDRAVYQDRF